MIKNKLQHFSHLVDKGKTCIVLVGPTAIGKIALGIEIAEHFNTQIISADSRQCYKELNIGVAKPSLLQLDTIPHHFINSHSIHEDINAGIFEAYALQKAEEIFATNNIAVMVGGTGLYVKTFCEGIDNIPTIPTQLRDEIIEKYNVHGIEWLQIEIKKTDPQFYMQGEIQNPQRLMRALEVVKFTGKSIIEFRKQQKNKEILISLKLD